MKQMNQVILFKSLVEWINCTSISQMYVNSVAFVWPSV